MSTGKKKTLRKSDRPYEGATVVKKRTIPQKGAERTAIAASMLASKKRSTATHAVTLSVSSNAKPAEVDKRSKPKTHRKTHAYEQRASSVAGRLSATGDVKSIKVQRASGGYWILIDYYPPIFKAPREHVRISHLWDGVFRTLDRHCGSRDNIEKSTSSESFTTHLEKKRAKNGTQGVAND